MEGRHRVAQHGQPRLATVMHSSAKQLLDGELEGFGIKYFFGLNS